MQIWQHVYDPLGNLLLSLLAAPGFLSSQYALKI